jgi:hypothetical protein
LGLHQSRLAQKAVTRNWESVVGVSFICPNIEISLNPEWSAAT